MTRLRAIAVAVALGLTGAAAPVVGIAPASANGLSSCVLTSDLTSPFYEVVQQALDDAQRELRRQGVNTDRVEIWGGCLRAFVTLPDGRTVNRFFDPTTLAPVTYGNAGVSD
jgi:hypothetical protein